MFTICVQFQTKDQTSLSFSPIALVESCMKILHVLPPALWISTPGLVSKCQGCWYCVGTLGQVGGTSPGWLYRKLRTIMLPVSRRRAKAFFALRTKKLLTLNRTLCQFSL